MTVSYKNKNTLSENNITSPCILKENLNEYQRKRETQQPTRLNPQL